MAPGTPRFNTSAQLLLRTLKKHNFRAALRRSVEKEQRELEKEGRLKRLTGIEYLALRSQVRADVEAYMLDHGQDGLTDAVIERWTGAATKNCLQQMIGAIAEEPASPQVLEVARRRIQERMARHPPTTRQQDARTKGVEQIAAQLPAAPSPAYIAKNGTKALEKLDIFAELNILYQDARTMRQSSVRVGKDGHEVVANPRTFDRSISRRLEILATSIATQKELWDLQRMEAFYSTIISVIAEADPATSQEIQRRLAEMNIHVGAT